MRVLVIDVAAEHSGAKTILEQFCKEFEDNKDNEYIVLLSTLKYADADNVKYKNFEWIKKSFLHRAIFDRIIMRKVIKEYKPDLVFSLQNNAVYAGNVIQYVYFQNALPLSEKRFKREESRYLWFYQTFIARIIRHSLKDASRIYVQTEWMKRSMIRKWGIREEILYVKKPIQELKDMSLTKRNDPDDSIVFFYPANFSPYKNHNNLVKAFSKAYLYHNKRIELILTGYRDNFQEELIKEIEQYKLPVSFVGRLNFSEMERTYLRSVLIFPSYIETIGLPILEAKQYGSWILCSDLEYARESIGDYEKVMYFNPFSVESIFKTIMNMIEKDKVL